MRSIGNTKLDLPADVKERLAGFEEMVGKVDENKWFSLVQFKSAWQM